MTFLPKIKFISSSFVISVLFLPTISSAGPVIQETLKIENILDKNLLSEKKLSFLVGSSLYHFKQGQTGFNAYVNDKYAIYFNKNCNKSRLTELFYLHVYPKDIVYASKINPDITKQGMYGINFEFSKADVSVTMENKCLAIIKLPSWQKTKVGLGQFNPQNGVRSWDVIIDTP